MPQQRQKRQKTLQTRQPTSTSAQPSVAPSRRRFLAGLAAAPAAAALLSAPSGAVAAPASKLIDAHWTQSGSVGSVDHASWGRFLSTYLRPSANGVTLVDYGGVSDADRTALQGYLADLQAVVATELTRDAGFAYWVNLYNALTIELVLEEYPVDSIKKVRGGFFNTGPWTDKAVTVEGRSLSLDDIEHGILRPIWKDPRIHYAVNCASIGCPNLAPKPFTAAGLDDQLGAAAQAYVNDPRGASFDRRGRLIVSSIYSWFKEDFGDTDAGVIAHLKQFATPELKARLETIDEVYDDAYDWSLNDATSS